MRDENYCTSRRCQSLEKREAFRLKRQVANGYCFVDNEEGGMKVGMNCKSNPSHHSARVGSNWMMEELTHVCKIFNIAKIIINVLGFRLIEFAN